MPRFSEVVKIIELIDKRPLDTDEDHKKFQDGRWLFSIQNSDVILEVLEMGGTINKTHPLIYALENNIKSKGKDYIEYSYRKDIDNLLDVKSDIVGSIIWEHSDANKKGKDCKNLTLNTLKTRGLIDTKVYKKLLNVALNELDTIHEKERVKEENNNKRLKEQWLVKEAGRIRMEEQELLEQQKQEQEKAELLKQEEAAKKQEEWNKFYQEKIETYFVNPMEKVRKTLFPNEQDLKEVAREIREEKKVQEEEKVQEQKKQNLRGEVYQPKIVTRINRTRKGTGGGPNERS